MIQIFTDGGCRNLSIGAWSYIVVKDGVVLHTQTGASLQTTNNKMELTAIYQALCYIKMYDIKEAVIYSDSQYAVNAINVWYNNWLTANALDGKKNIELLAKIHELKNPSIRFAWVKGHAKNKFNNLADQLVNEAMDAVTQ